MKRQVLTILGLTVTALLAHESTNFATYPIEEKAPILKRENVRPVDLTGYRNFIGNANTTKDVEKLQSRPGMPFII